MQQMEHTKADSISEAAVAETAAATRKSHTTLQMEMESLMSSGCKAVAVDGDNGDTLGGGLLHAHLAVEPPELSMEASCSKDMSQLNDDELNSYCTLQSLDKTNAILLAATSSAAAEALRMSMQVDGTTQCHNSEFRSRESTESIPSIGSLVCRICHNADNPEQLVSPCLCKGSLSYVHINCLERWISTSRCTTCELCKFKYNTEQKLRYTCMQSLRIWYSRAMSRRTLQEDCQMFSLLTLVAFGIIGTLLVGIQYYGVHSQSWQLSKLWTRSWMLFFLFMTIAVYFANVYLLIKSQLTPWYRWWQSAQDIRLILENRRPFPNPNRGIELPTARTSEGSMLPEAGYKLTAPILNQKPMPMPMPMPAAPIPPQETTNTNSCPLPLYASFAANTETVDNHAKVELGTEANRTANEVSQAIAVTTATAMGDGDANSRKSF